MLRDFSKVAHLAINIRFVSSTPDTSALLFASPPPSLTHQGLTCQGQKVKETSCRLVLGFLGNLLPMKRTSAKNRKRRDPQSASGQSACPAEKPLFLPPGRGPRPSPHRPGHLPLLFRSTPARDPA